MDASTALTWTFVAALALATATRLWLARRQMRHVAAHRAAVPDPFGASIPLEAHQKAADYTLARTRFASVKVVIDALVLLLLTLGGVLQWISAQWERVFALETLWHGAAVIASVFLLLGILSLPASIYRIFVLEERFGFNKMTPRLLAVDILKGLALALALGLPLLLAVLWLMLKAGAYWWIYVWVVVVLFSLAMQLVVPAFIMPWFNKFSALEEGELRRRLEELLARCGFRSRGLFVMDGSKRSSHGNAFFAGMGRSKRIVLFDTLVERLGPSEVEAVLAHELGHYRLHHIRKLLIYHFASNLVLLFVLGLLVDRPWFYEGLGMHAMSLPIGLLLFLLVAPVFEFFLHPVDALLSRKHEFEADAYATEHSSAADLETALVKMYKDNAATLTPDPLHSAFYDSHPPAALRIARLRTA